MDRGLFDALIPVIGLAGNAVSQISFLRLSRRTPLLRSIYAGFAAGAAVVCVAQAAARGGAGPLAFAGELLANLVIYAMLGYGYFHFINLGETGRRARLLRELYDSPEGLTLAQLLSRYGSKQMLAMRLARLTGNGQIVLEDGRYRLGRPTVATMGRIILFLKKAILGRSSEFE